MTTFQVKYELGHQYDETWEPCAFYCPSCGKRDVWEEAGAGDYYVGTDYICRSCWGTFNLPNGVYFPHERDWQHRQRKESLSAADKSTPRAE